MFNGETTVRSICAHYFIIVLYSTAQYVADFTAPTLSLHFLCHENLILYESRLELVIVAEFLRHYFVNKKI